MNNGKPRIGVITPPSGDPRLVWMNEEGLCHSYLKHLEYEAYAPQPGFTLTPLEDWIPPVENGVWWCSDANVAFVLNGKQYDNDGYEIEPVSPVQRIGDIPTGWEGGK